jgi:hypothetical protein
VVNVAHFLHGNLCPSFLLTVNEMRVRVARSVLTLPFLVQNMSDCSFFRSSAFSIFADLVNHGT